MQEFPEIEISKAKVIAMKKELLGGFQEICQPKSPLYLLHFIAAGIIERTLSNIHAFDLLIENKNFLCAASVLRLQIDTAMRGNAFNLVGDPNKLAHHISKGGRFSNQRDMSGAEMRDVYLRKQLNRKYPWINDVYEQTSGAVHLSNRHLFAAIGAADGDEKEITMEITGLANRPEEEFCEIYAAFAESVEITYRVTLGCWVSG